MVKRSIDQKLRLRIFDARHRRIESGAVVKNQMGVSGVEGGKGICYQWNEKGQCSKGDQCSFQHEGFGFRALDVTRSKCVEEKKYPRQK